MNALAHAASVPAPARERPGHERTVPGLARVGVCACSFFALAAFAALEFATLITHVPVVRVLGVVAICALGGSLLALSGRLALPLGLAGWLRLLLVLAMLVVTLIVIGVPASDLRPARWGALADGLTHGVHALRGWLWPYRGSDHWARLAVLMVIPAAVLSAACICFWPARRGGWSRSVAALAVLVGICLTGLANAGPGTASGFQGAVLLALIAAWLWAPTIAAADAARAAGWLVLCGALGLVAAPALNAGRPWIDYRGGGSSSPGTRSTFQWDQTYGPLPWSRSAATMFELASPSAASVRVTSLDRFDGLRFLRSDSPPGSPQLDLGRAAASCTYSSGSSRDAGSVTPIAAGRTSSRRGRTTARSRACDASDYTRTTVYIDGLRSALLPGSGSEPLELRWLATGQSPLVCAAAFVGEAARVGSTDACAGARRAADGTVALGSPPAAGSAYTIVSYTPTPSAPVLRSAPRSFPRGYLPYSQFQLPPSGASAFHPVNLAAEARVPYARSELVGSPVPGRSPASFPGVAAGIEASPYARMFALSRRLAAGRRSTFAVAESIERYLLDNYGYDEDVPQARYPLEAFLFEQRRGYCQQFSGAMTLMLRMDGIPARVGVGFQPELLDARTGSWRVRALDAHAWVEVFFSGIGWVSFDPTPARVRTTGTGAGGFPSKGSLLGSGAAADTAGASRLQRRLTPAKTTRGGGRLGVIVVALAIIICAALASAWLAGNRRLRRALREDADGAVAELRSALRRLGYPHFPHTTLAQLEAGLRGRRADEARRYLAALRELRFAGGGASQRAHPSRRGRAALRASLAFGRGPLGRMRALLALPPASSRR
jgi:type II secretory pathway pseudopilin PulG